MKTCSECNKTFSARSNLRRHLKVIHGEPPRNPPSLICPLCEDALTREKYFLDHLRHTHDIIVDQRQLFFDNEKEFQKWKVSMEKATRSYYRKDRTKKDAKQTTMYFTCNRSGIFSPRQERKRKLRAQGSRKINRTCPSKLIVCKSHALDKLDVYFIPTHVGHETDLKHLNLHKEDRIKIAKNLEQGVDKNQLLAKVKESIGASGSRLNLLTMKDLRNIKDRFIHNSLRKSVSTEKISNEKLHKKVQGETVKISGRKAHKPESSTPDCIPETTSQEVNVQIDGEIHMEDDSSIFFDHTSGVVCEDKQKLVEDIMGILDPDIPLETLNSIKEMIEAAKQKKLVVNMGVPIQSTRKKQSRTAGTANTEVNTPIIRMPVFTSEVSPYKLRKILPKPTEAVIQPLQTLPVDEKSLNDSVDNEITVVGVLESTDIQLVGNPLNPNVSKISDTYYVIIPSK